MGIFSRKPATMEELLESNKDFNSFVHKVMYHLWFRSNVNSGNLDNQINMLWNYYEAKQAPSAVAHELLQAEIEVMEKLKGANHG